MQITPNEWLIFFPVHTQIWWRGGGIYGHNLIQKSRFMNKKLRPCAYGLPSLSLSLPLGWGLAEGEEVSHLFHLTSLTWLEQHCASLWGKGAGLLALAWARASALVLLTWKPLPSFRSTTLNVLDVYTSKGNLKQNRRTLLFWGKCSDCMYNVDFKLWISTENTYKTEFFCYKKHCNKSNKMFCRPFTRSNH